MCLFERIWHGLTRGTAVWPRSCLLSSCGQPLSLPVECVADHNQAHPQSPALSICTPRRRTAVHHRCNRCYGGSILSLLELDSRCHLHGAPDLPCRSISIEKT